MIYILLFCLLKDGDIDFILAPAVGSLTTAATGTGQGPSTSTIPGETLAYFVCLGIWNIKELPSEISFTDPRLSQGDFL